MGTLIAMSYPTKLFANQADHTYVKCSTGKKAWSCWGGKTGGNALRSGTGSTNRANSIAKPNEKAGIKCYLINGVCHQAANRILLPAGITVRGARGYSISEALFGTYGRVGIWPCKSPFNKNPNVTGDLPVCIAAAPSARSAKAAAARALTTEEKLDWQYISGVMKLYDEATPMIKSRTVTAAQASAFHLKLFMYMAEFHLGPMLDKPLTKRLQQIRGKTEKSRLRIEAPFVQSRAHAKEFVEAFNEITLGFQDDMADSMTAQQYKTLFDLNPDERIVLADQRIVSEVFKME